MITTVLNQIKKYALEDALVNSVTQGRFQNIDISKNGKYAVVHTQINNGSFNSDQTIIYNIQIGCYQQRDTNNKIEPSYYGNDNEVDNINECVMVLNRLWLKLKRDWDKNDITASENPSFELDYLNKTNTLDGAVLTLTIEIPNIQISLC